jgi:signal transduction histidine kinase
MTGPPARADAPGYPADARILIVDDEPANTRILERLLEQAGYAQLVVTNDAREAIPLYEEFRPDVVLLDLHMPKVDGYEILGTIADPRGEAMRPPVIVLTADATRQARERALGLGAADFLTKPLDHLEVLLRVRHHLAKRWLELELLLQNADLEQVVAERTAVIRETLERLQKTADERRRLAAALVSAQETERRRIAADIHDGSVQALVALGIRLELAARRVADDALRADLLGIRASVSTTLEDLRGLIFRLTPASLEQAGLAVALGEAVERLVAVGGPTIEYVADLVDGSSPKSAVVLYRIAQEALANALRHARAGRIVVSLAEDGDGIRVQVRDDGQGFQVPADGSLPSMPGHLGLPSMQERAELAGGWWRIESVVGGGTTVTAWVPGDTPDTDEGAAPEAAGG